MTNAAAGSPALILTQSKFLRLLTVLLFYLAQGFPIGLFFYAIPAWMAGNGAGTADIAVVVGTSTLPWSLKLVNGFLIDRYTFLAMGRRRVWIVGAQALLVGVFVAGALLSPPASDLVMLATLGFLANFATTFQDVGIDSLIIDIMPESERSRAAGFMFGAQVIGIAIATVLGGSMFKNFGFSGGMLAAAVVPGLILIYGILIRERESERRLPWSKGDAHPDSMAIQVDAWWPLLKRALKALFAPICLLFVPIMLARAVPSGGAEAFHPVLFTQTVGWEMDQWTNFYSAVTLGGGIFSLLLGGWIVEKVGPERAMLGAATAGAILMAVMGATQFMWGNAWYSAGYVVLIDMLFLFYSVGMIPVCMRLCSPAVAATQFTIFMAIGNLGRPIGASIAAIAADFPHWLYWAGALAWAVAAVVLIFVRFPEQSQVEEMAAQELPHGDGIAPRVN